MFGLIIAGRLVQTEFQQISDHQVVFSVDDVGNANHIVVFMTGQVPFPDGMGGAVYYCLPGSDGESWFYLGQICNSKPSAIFKITNLKQEGGSSLANPFTQMTVSQPHIAKVGISAQPLDQLNQMTAMTNTNVSKLDTFMEFSTKALENLFNYAASFAITPSQMTQSHATQTFVPLGTLQTWFDTFRRRLQADAFFWRK